MSEPISTKKLGGVTYNANQFIGEELPNGKFRLTAKKTGETLIFGQQPEGVPQQKDVYSDRDYVSNGVRMRRIDPKIELDVDKGVFYDDNNFSLTDIMGATFSSSQKAISHVDLENCENTKVDLAANDSRWFGDDANIQGGKGNRVVLDSKDSADIGYNDIKGAGTADQKDYE